MSRFLIFAVITMSFVQGFPLMGKAQNAPVTTIATIGDLTPGQQVTVPVTVTGFNTITSITLYLNYNYANAHYVQCNKNPLLAGNYSVGDLNLGNGYHQIIIGWYGSSTTLPDGSWIFNYIFSYLNNSDSLSWYDMGPSCEYTDGNFNTLNDLPTSQYYINGLLCGELINPGHINGDSTICTGQQGVIYQVNAIPGTTSYHWTVPTAAIITSPADTNFIIVDYPSGAISGEITVNGTNLCGPGPVSVLPVSIFPLPTASVSGGDSLCDDGSTATIRIDLTGAPPWNFYITNGSSTTMVSNQYTTPYFFSTSEPGLYFVPTISDINCAGASNGNAQVIVSPVPAAPIIEQNDATLISNAPFGNQWYFEQTPISGATEQSYLPALSGNYSDIITINGCSSDISNYLHVVISNTTQPMSSTFQIIPNPAKDYFLLKSSGMPVKTTKVSFFTSDGILIKEFDTFHANDTSECIIDIRELTPGLYFLAIHYENKSIIQKLVVL